MSHDPPFAAGTVAGMPLTVTTEDRARAFVVSRLASRRWWAIPITGEPSLELVARIERDLGDRRGLEAVYPLPLPGLPIVVLVAKERVGKARMQRLLRACGGSAQIADGQDVLVPYHVDGEGGLPAGLAGALAAWVEWLQPGGVRAA